MVCDTNYGMRRASWDQEAMTEEGLNKLLQGFKTVTTATFHTVVLYVSLPMVGMAEKALLANNYVHVQFLPWFKVGQNLTGPSFVLIPSVGEVLVIAMSGASQAELCKKYFDWAKDPLRRPNLLVAPTVAKRKVDGLGTIINQHEKPSSLMSYLGPKVCVEGTTALVAGSGAFGDVMGLMAAGISCYAVENDPAQFKQTAILIPTLELENMADEVTPMDEVNVRLATSTAFPEPVAGYFLCCICKQAVKDKKEGCKCTVCEEATICASCLSTLSDGAPKCPSCARSKGPEKSIASEESEAPAA